MSLESRWACVDGRLGVIGIYGADSLCVHRVPQRRGGKHGGLYTEEICFPCLTGLTSWDNGATILDTAYAVLSDANPDKTKTVAETIVADKTEPSGTLRAVSITGADGRRYRIEVNTAALRLYEELADGQCTPIGATSSIITFDVYNVRRLALIKS